jgi:hypothetical protein
MNDFKDAMRHYEMAAGVQFKVLRMILHRLNFQESQLEQLKERLDERHETHLGFLRRCLDAPEAPDHNEADEDDYVF